MRAESFLTIRSDRKRIQDAGRTVRYRAPEIPPAPRAIEGVFHEVRTGERRYQNLQVRERLT